MFCTFCAIISSEWTYSCRGSGDWKVVATSGHLNLAAHPPTCVGFGRTGRTPLASHPASRLNHSIWPGSALFQPKNLAYNKERLTHGFEAEVGGREAPAYRNRGVSAQLLRRRQHVGG